MSKKSKSGKSSSSGKSGAGKTPEAGGNRKQRRATESQARKGAEIISMTQQTKGRVVLPAVAPGQKRVLHVGCGDKELGSGLHKTFRTKEWVEVRLDIVPAVKPDIVADMMDMHMIPDNSFDAVWSSHNIEHVWVHQVPVALKEFMRVLKPGGFLLLMTPDMESVAEAVGKKGLEGVLYNSPAGPITALDIMYGHAASLARGFHFMGHKMGFSASTLGKRFLAAGLVDVKVDRKQGQYNLTIIGYKRPKTKDNTKLSIVQEDINEMMMRRDELDVPPQRKYDFKF